MAKDDNGQFYVFADTRELNDANQYPGHVHPCRKNATSVTVVNENRTIPVTNGVFTDTFATAATVHIYEVNDGSGGTTGSTTPTVTGITTSPATGDSLVTNGNFATDSFSGWTLGGNYAPLSYGPQVFIDTNAEGGSTYAAGMGSVGSDGALSQTIATTAGQTYRLSFWLQNEASGANDFKAIWNGQTLLSLANAAQSGYTQYNYTVTATGSSSTLQFSARNDPSHWDLDNISLAPNGTATTSYNADGSYQVTYAGVTGLAYSSYEDVYNTAGALVADAQDMTNGSGNLLLSANGLTISSSSAKLS